MGIGGALMVSAAVMKGVQLWMYYDRTFIPIPIMIVDEADLVTYTTGKDGQQQKNIDFDQFVYYDVVKCNRQEVGGICGLAAGIFGASLVNSATKKKRMLRRTPLWHNAFLQQSRGCQSIIGRPDQ